MFSNMIISHIVDLKNTYGETRSPWRTPYSSRILMASSPPKRMYASILLKKRETHLRIEGPKLNIFIHSSICLCESESNAFLKSISRIRDLIFLLLVCFIRFRMLMMQDPMLPNYFTYECPKSLGKATRGYLVGN